MEVPDSEVFSSTHWWVCLPRHDAAAALFAAAKHVLMADGVANVEMVSRKDDDVVGVSWSKVLSPIFLRTSGKVHGKERMARDFCGTLKPPRARPSCAARTPPVICTAVTHVLMADGVPHASLTWERTLQMARKEEGKEGKELRKESHVRDRLSDGAHDGAPSFSSTSGPERRGAWRGVLANMVPGAPPGAGATFGRGRRRVPIPIQSL